jgi:hypothetical protein
MLCCSLEQARFWPDVESRHGFEGWLPTSLAEREMLLNDEVLMKLSNAALEESLESIGNPIKRIFLKLRTRGDSNDCVLSVKDLMVCARYPLPPRMDDEREPASIY